MNDSKILKNATSNVLLMLLRIAITLVITPLLVKNLGNYDYGVWEITMAIFGYLGLLDVGIPTALEVFTAKYAASRNMERLCVLHRTSLCLFMFIGFVAGAGWVFWSLHWVPDISDGDQQKYWIFAIIIFVQCLVQFPGLVAQSILQGLQRYSLTNAIKAIISVFAAAILFIFINEENALFVVACVSLAGQFTKFTIYHFVLRIVVFKKAGVYVGRFEKAQAKELAKFGSKSFVQGSALQAEELLAPILIAFATGPAAVVFYSIPNALFVYAKNIVRSVSAVFMPAFSQLREEQDIDAERTLHANGSKIATGIMFLLVLGVAQLGPPFIASWIGPSYGEEARELAWPLAVYFGLTLANPFAVRYLTGINKHGILAIARPIKFGLMVPLAWFWLDRFGLVGIAYAGAVSELLFLATTLHVTCANLGIRLSVYFRGSFLPALLPSVALVLVSHYGLKYARHSNMFQIFALAMLAGATYLGIFWITGLSKVQRKTALSWARKRIPFTGSV